MRTRCPTCSTVFRATSEQLRLKAGKVRCGNCQGVFNAFEHVVPDVLPQVEQVSDVPQRAGAPDISVARQTVGIVPALGKASESSIESGAAIESILSGSTAGPVGAMETKNPAGKTVQTVAQSRREPSKFGTAAWTPLPEETAEASTQAARDAGLVAARELIDTKSYNRWAAGTLADSSLGAFGEDSKPRATWPFVLFALLLMLALGAQLVHSFRTEVVRYLPATAPLYLMAGLTIPPSKNPELVAIDASDLQSDTGRGLLVLQASLANRAAYPQAWPALELALTDMHDAVVSRRVLGPDEYLPYATVPEEFPANSEVAVKLWIEAADIGAAGYRLYVFYP